MCLSCTHASRRSYTRRRLGRHCSLVDHAVFRVLGVSTVIAKLPNVFVMAGLIALAAWIGAWRWSRRVGLLAVSSLATMPLFFEDTLFPVNDLVFTLLFTALVGPRSTAPGVGRATMRGWPPGPASGVAARSDGRQAAGLLLSRNPAVRPDRRGGVAAFIVNGRVGRSPRWRSVGIAAGGGSVVSAVGDSGSRHLGRRSTPRRPTTPGARTIRRNRSRVSIASFGADSAAPAGPDRLRLRSFPWRAGAAVYAVVARFDGGSCCGCSCHSSRSGCPRGGAEPGFGTMLLCAGVPYRFSWCSLGTRRSGTLSSLSRGSCCMPRLGSTGPMTRSLHGCRRGMAARARAAAWLSPSSRRSSRPIRAIFRFGPRRRRAATRRSLSDWLKANTSPDDVMMTRNPWEVSWHSNRRTVMLPIGSIDDIYAVMHQYGVTVLELDHLNDPATIRQSLAALFVQGDAGHHPPLRSARQRLSRLFGVAAGRMRGNRR